MFILAIPAWRDPRFKVRIALLNRFLAALRRYAQALPDARAGQNTSYTMADFTMVAFAPFFMQSPAFLAHRRHRETVQGRANCQTLFGMGKIPGDSQVRAKLDPVEPVHFYPIACELAPENWTGG